MSLVVQKYGGSSLANPDLIKNVAMRVASAHDRSGSVVATVSAMGNLTDDLLEAASQVSDRPDPRELDVPLSTGELQSCALVAMALRSIGKRAVSGNCPTISPSHASIMSHPLVVKLMVPQN